MLNGILLLYSPLNHPRRPQIERLSELHPHLVLLSESYSNDNLPQWANPLFKAVITDERANLSSFLTQIKQYCSLLNKEIDGIISLSETGIYFCSQLAEKLNLCFASSEIVVRARDKSLMRQFFSENDLPSVAFGRAGSSAEALEIAQRIGFPLVLKPLLAGGSLFVRRIDNDRDLADCFDEYLHNSIVPIAADPLVQKIFQNGNRPMLLMEKLVEGRTQFETTLDLPVGEVSIEGCVIEGNVYALGFHDKPLPANGPYYEEVLWSTPTRLSARWQSELTELAQKTITVLNYRDGIFHLEARTTDSGPVLLEVAARMGGGPIFRSLRESSGIDLIEIMYNVATRQPVDESLLTAHKNIPVMTFGIFAPEGMLKAIEGLETIRAHPNVIETAVYEFPGTYIRRAPYSDHCTVHVMITAETHAEIENIGKWVESTLKFVTEEGEPR